MKQLKNKKGILAGICIVAILVTGAGVAMYANGTSAEGEVVYKETTVVKGNLTVGVTESGSVSIGTLTQEFGLGESESGSSTQSYAGMGSMAGNAGNSLSGVSLEVEEVYVAVGQKVEEGEPLLKISAESIAEYRENLKDAVNDASASLSEAKLSAEKKQLSADYNYSANIAKGNVAEANYNATLEQLQAEVDAVQEDVDYYAAAADYYWNLVVDGDDSYSEKLAEVQEKYDEAAAKLTTTQNNYTTKALQAKKEYEETMLNYNSASTQYTIDVNGIGNDVDSASETLADVKEALQEFEDFIGDGIVYAEYSGKLMTVGYSAGDALSSDTAIADFSDATAVTMTVAVSQEDISQIAIGDVVMIELTAYEGEEFSGMVSGMDTSTSSGSSTVSYNVTVTFNGDISKVYADMTGNVTFIQKQVPDVVYVSNKAIINEGTASYVKVKQEDGTFKKVEVVTGFSDGVNVEIVSGLNEGDIVIIESRVVSES